MTPEFPIWAIFSKLMIRKTGRRTRVYIEIPTGAAPRARRLHAYLRGGRVEEGTVLVEGRELPRVMALLRFPESMVDCVTRLQVLRGTPGISTPDAVLEERERIVFQLRKAAREAYNAL